MRLNFIIPTYNRVPSLQRLVFSLLSNADHPEYVYFTLVLHQGDKETADYATTIQNCKTATENLDKPHLARFHNMGYKTAVKSDIYWYGGDDFECVTKGWDTKVITGMDESNGWALVCGPDGYLGKPSCATFFFVSHRVLSAVGEFVCPYYAREATDLVWSSIMEPLGLVMWKNDLRMEHWHATRHGGKNDATFQRLCSTDAPVYGKDFNNYVHEKQIAIQEAMKCV